ncbi:hypothetical protein [Actinocorallia longicatena]|uniref:Uncharacterized protein n=1 Tax=Actinocorallia longicatena TaxID=111803 RepID=A0ABP6QLZ6_9ACTN
MNGFGTRHSFEPGWSRFLWSERVRRRGLSLDGHDGRVIGAPWNYLLELEPEQPLSKREGVIWYPFHGWEQQRVIGDHKGLIEEIRDVETGPVTVCLYWLEYKDSGMRELYESAGFRVISHGFRGNNYRYTDTNFLKRQLAELRTHRRVASNRLSTAILYGISVGCEPAVYGDPMVLDDAHPVFGGVGRLRRQWPELHGERVDPGRAREIAREELGTDYRAEPAELRELFRWPAAEEGR